MIETDVVEATRNDGNEDWGRLFDEVEQLGIIIHLVSFSRCIQGFYFTSHETGPHIAINSDLPVQERAAVLGQGLQRARSEMADTPTLLKGYSINEEEETK